MTEKNNANTVQNDTDTQYAIINETFDSGLGVSMWVIILSVLGFLIGILLLIIGFADSDDDTIRVSLIILGSSVAVFGLGFVIILIVEKGKPESPPSLLNCLVLKNNHFHIANCLVRFGGVDAKTLRMDQTRLLLDFAIKDVENTLHDKQGVYQLDIAIAVNEQGNLISGDEFRIIKMALSQDKQMMWNIDHHKQSGLVWLFSKQKSFHLPIAAVRKKKLIQVFENLNTILSASVKPQLDVRVSFLLPGSNISAATIAFGLVGGAATAFFDWQTGKNVEKIFADSPLSIKEGEENIIDTLKQNRWQFRIVH